MGPPRPGPLLNRPVRDNCSQRGKPSQANGAPKEQGRSKAIHVSEDIAAGREKAARVIEKLRGLRLARAASWWKRRSRRRSPTTLSRRSTDGGFAPTTRSSASCARSDGNLAAARLPPHRWHGMIDQEISQHRVAEGSADERCHHRVSQGRAPLKVRKSLDTTWAFVVTLAGLNYL
jgi:hypothetical protein